MILLWCFACACLRRFVDVPSMGRLICASCKQTH